MFSVTEALSETGYLWLMRSLNPLSKWGGSDESERLCSAPSLWGPVDMFAQKVVVCLLETGPVCRAVLGTARVQVLTCRGSCGCTKSRPRVPPAVPGCSLLQFLGLSSIICKTSCGSGASVRGDLDGGCSLDRPLWEGRERFCSRHPGSLLKVPRGYKS